MSPTMIPPPIPVLIHANSLSDAWEKTIYFVSHYGTPSTPDYKDTPTIRCDCKLVINNPMEGFYKRDKDGNILTRMYSPTGKKEDEFETKEVNFKNILHPFFLKSAQETGVMTQGIQSIENYVYFEMNRRFADDYHARMLRCDDTIPPYSYAHRLMYYPRTMEPIQDMFNNIGSYENDADFVNNLERILNEHQYIDQLEFIRDELPKREGSRRIKANLWIPEIDLFTYENQPCFQQFKVEYLGNGKVHLEILFRSWDAMNGLPANLPGICNLIFTEILEPNGFELVRLTCNGEDLHIYNNYWDDAKKITVTARGLEDILY